MFLLANLETAFTSKQEKGKEKKSRPKNWNIVILDIKLTVMFTNSAMPSTTLASLR